MYVNEKKSGIRTKNLCEVVMSVNQSKGRRFFFSFYLISEVYKIVNPSQAISYSAQDVWVREKHGNLFFKTSFERNPMESCVVFYFHLESII